MFVWLILHKIRGVGGFVLGDFLIFFTQTIERVQQSAVESMNFVFRSFTKTYTE